MNDLHGLFRELLFSVSLATPIGALILKASCALYNLLAGVLSKLASHTTAVEREPASIAPPTSDPAPANEGAAPTRGGTIPGVPMPRIERAVFIIFLASLIEALGRFTILRLLHLAARSASHGVAGALTLLLLSFPLGILVLAGLNAAMLPTSFGKGLLVALLFVFLFSLVAILCVFALTAMDFGLSLV